MKLSIIARIGVISLMWSRFLQRELLPHGITLKQIYLLKHLIKTDYIYPADIAELLFCDRPTASVIIRNLEKKGWLEKRPDPDDGKRLRISITLSGAKMVSQVLDSGYKGDKAFEPETVLTPEEINELERLLIKIHSFVKRL